MAFGALDERTSTVMAFQRHTAALACLGTAQPGLGWDLLYATAWNGRLAFRERRKGSKLSSLVGTSGRVQPCSFAVCVFRYFGIMHDEPVGVYDFLFALIDFFVGDSAIRKCCNETGNSGQTAPFGFAVPLLHFDLVHNDLEGGEPARIAAGILLASILDHHSVFARA
jgi:hypothetical protein